MCTAYIEEGKGRILGRAFCCHLGLALFAEGFSLGKASEVRSLSSPGPGLPKWILKRIELSKQECLFGSPFTFIPRTHCIRKEEKRRIRAWQRDNASIFPYPPPECRMDTHKKDLRKEREMRENPTFWESFWFRKWKPHMFFMHGEFFPLRANNTHTPFFLGGTLFCLFRVGWWGGAANASSEKSDKKRPSSPLCGRRLNLNPQLFCVYTPCLPPSMVFASPSSRLGTPSPTSRKITLQCAPPPPIRTLFENFEKGGILPGKHLGFFFFQKKYPPLCDSK